MGEMQPKCLYIAPLQLPPPIIKRILENELSWNPKDVVSWYWYVVITVGAYQNFCMC